MMGRVLMQQNEPDAARKWVEQVTARLTGTPDLSYEYQVYLADALTQLGQISLQSNSPRQAENYLKQALETVSDYVPALLAMAKTNVLLAGDAFVASPREQLLQAAEALYARAIEVAPSNPEVYLEAASFYHRSKTDNEKARQYYNLYVDNGGRDSQVNAWLVEVGGEPRTELAVVAAAGASATSGTLVTTATTTLTTGPLGAVLTTSTVSTAIPAGVVLPVDAMMAETTGTAGITTTTGQLPAGATIPTPLMTFPVPGPGMPTTLPGTGMPAAPGALPGAAGTMPGAAGTMPGAVGTMPGAVATPAGQP
jgi:Tfp pilus assembly protein PilF